MFIQFKNIKLTLKELNSGKLAENILSDFEQSVCKFIREWLSKPDYFSQQTSGSTGSPKVIQLTRIQMEYSAAVTMDTLDPESIYSSALICISPEFIGGKMLIVRALLRDLDLHICEPNELVSFLATEGKYDLVSLVPLQIQKILDHTPSLLNRFKTVLIGGAPLKMNTMERLKKYREVSFFQTYGMTETSSHIALRNIDSQIPDFQTIGDVRIAIDDRDCLKIRGTVTSDEWLQTNDRVELTSTNSFVWLGRADLVINSGGVKVSPELVEKLLAPQINLPFFIVGIPDEQLGNRVALIIETAQQRVFNLDFSQIPKYHKPKEILKVKTFEYTPTGKINRTLTLQKLEL